MTRLCTGYAVQTFETFENKDRGLLEPVSKLSVHPFQSSYSLSYTLWYLGHTEFDLPSRERFRTLPSSGTVCIWGEAWWTSSFDRHNLEVSENLRNPNEGASGSLKCKSYNWTVKASLKNPDPPSSHLTQRGHSHDCPWVGCHHTVEDVLGKRIACAIMHEDVLCEAPCR